MKTLKHHAKRIVENFYLVLILIFLYAPIVTMMVLSFNSSKSRTQWGGFTLQWYTQMFDSATIMDALVNTLLIAFVSALIATIIGTAASIAINSMKPLPRTIIMGSQGSGRIPNLCLFQGGFPGYTPWSPVRFPAGIYHVPG